MIPILDALIKAALGTEVLRSEIEDGVKEGKDKAREEREGIKSENERWEKEKEKEKEKNPKSKEACGLCDFVSKFLINYGFLCRRNKGVKPTNMRSWISKSHLR
jgi:hypothetical protein